MHIANCKSVNRIWILLTLLLLLVGCGVKPKPEAEKSKEISIKIQESETMQEATATDVDVAKKLPEELRFARLYYDVEGNLYAYKVGSSDYTKLDKECNVLVSGAVDGDIVGFVENPASGELFWYGRRDGEIVVCNLERGTSYPGEMPKINSFEKYTMTFDEDGNLYLVTLRELWLIGTETRQVCNLEQRGYVLTELLQFTSGAEGNLLLTTRMDGKDILLTLIPQEGEEDPRKEIVLAVEEGNIVLNRTAARFNRANDDYYVTIMNPEGKDIEDYRKQLQMELSAGKGPDMISDMFLMPAEPYAKGGYLEALTGLVDETAFVQGTIDGVSFGGALYGAPYEFSLYLCGMSTDLLDGKTDLSLMELMDTVRRSDVEILQGEADGSYIVYYYGLSDRKKATFIDWEKGISHLTEEPFLELLQFAYEYRDPLSMNEMKGKLAQQGKVAIVQGHVSSLWDTQFLTECFQGKEAYVGIPSEDGMYSRVYSRAVYLNHFSKVQEGCKEFVKFLLSEEMQRELAEWNAEKEGFASGSMPQLPTRKEILRSKLQKDREHVPEVTHMYGGLIFNNQEITEEKLEQLLRAIDGAKPIEIGDNDLLLMVSEELETFFAGEKTAEEAAKILHNRVQNMLDER